MGEKVQNMLKLIEEDGDSFAKRAEMYYKRRPELINFVEESYRAYRALAERYDHISTELQNANNTIATVFPERVQFSMDDDEDDDFGSSKPPKPLTQAPIIPNAPKVPDFPNQELKGIVASATNKIQPKRSPDPESPKKSVPKSGLSKVEALEQIDNNQKEILALQTVKEFIKSSYENGVTKYWEIENRIGELQERINNLQDEFEIGKAIEDNEARTIMAKAALQTCEETLTKLEEKQERAEKEAKVEYERVEDAGLRIKSLKLKLLPGEQENSDSKVEVQKRPEGAEELQVKTMEHFDAGSINSKDSKEVLTVTQLVVKIDELVTKVISLETAVSSQTAAADRLRTETDDLHQQIYTLEHEKATLLKENKDLINRLREMEEKMERLQDLNYDLQNHNKDLKKHFTETHSTLQDLSGKLHTVKPDEEIEITESMPEEESSSTGTKTPEEVEKQEDLQVPREASKKWKGLRLAVGGDKKKKVTILEKQEDPNSQEKDDKQDVVNNEQKKVAKGKDHEMNWQEMLLDGVEDKEKILLKEYTTILRNYKDLKKKHSENENRSRDALFETAMRVRELKTIITKRDEEIHSLRQKLELLQESSEGNNENQPVSIMSNDQSATNPDATKDKPKDNKTSEIPSTEEEGKDFKLVLVEQPQPISPVEEKLRTKIDALLDENLDFWLRFSDAFHQVQKFRSAFQDLQAETERKGKDESKEASDTADIKSDLRPIYKHITEIQTELTIWIEKSTLLKEELQGRFSSLCDIQEEMTKALTADAEEEMKFTSHMAAKFQGEVLNMKQENNKVRDELQAAFDHVTALRQEIEKTLKKLSEEFKLSESKKNSQPQSKSSSSGNRVPLRSFIFGTKQKKRSFFSYMHHKRSHGDRSGLPM